MKNELKPQAVAVIVGSSDAPDLSGCAEFYQCAAGVLLSVQVSGLPQQNSSGFFAMHIHEGESCSGAGFPRTGGHYNIVETLHPLHAGDLPPLLSCHGSAWLTVLSDRFCVEEVIGRTLVIHSSEDDFHTQPSGNAGVKIGCGEIKST
ncbi:MAG: superoxide dismutase family protein [Firmicutes bacterium]|nr:superoxide dismutase family protein [Bacillota bacterium]